MEYAKVPGTFPNESLEAYSSELFGPGCSPFVKIQTWTAGVFIAFSYVCSLYVHPWGPKFVAFPHRNRDDPDEIRSRFLRVFMASLLSCTASIVAQNAAGFDLVGSFHNMGFRMPGLLNAVLLPTLLTVILFAGPIVGDYMVGRWNGYNRVFINLLYRNLHYRRRVLRDSVYSYVWWRAYVVAPVSEEFVYRACLIPVIVHCYGATTAILLSPMSFGIAHLHHVFDRMRLGVPLKTALLATAFQICYTSVFGLYSAYLFVRTKHIIAPVLVHALCNVLGVPDVGQFAEVSPLRRLLVGATYLLGVLMWVFLIYPFTAPDLFSTVPSVDV